MIRASAKNHAYVTVVTDAADYAEVVAALADNDGQTTMRSVSVSRQGLCPHGRL